MPTEPPQLQTLNARWKLLRPVLAILVFFLSMEITFANMAIYALSKTFHADISILSWISTGYLITLAGGMIIAGKCNDYYGSLRTGNVGLVLFAIALAITGLAPDWQIAIVGRLIKGFAAALIMGSVMPLLFHSFPHHKKANAQAWGGAASALALAFAPMIGGSIIHYLGWRAAFLVQVPFCLIMMIPYSILCPRNTEKDIQTALPWFSAILLGAGILLVCAGTTTISESYAGWPTIILWVAGALSLVIYYQWDKRLHKPLMNFQLLRNPMALTANISRFLLQGKLFFYYFAVALLAQKALHMNPIETALIFIIPGLLRGISAIAGSWMMQRLAILPLFVGLVATIIGFVIQSNSTYVVAIWGLVVGNGLVLFGVGMCNTMLTTSVVKAVPHTQTGMANGLSTTFAFTGAGLVMTIATVAWQKLTVTRALIDSYSDIMTGFAILAFFILLLNITQIRRYNAL